MRRAAEVSTLAVEHVEPRALPPDLARLRAHAAVARALLDELDRAAPAPGRHAEAAMLSALAEQLADELGRLADRLLECAHAAARDAPPCPADAG
jgi:hypothetical protein